MLIRTIFAVVGLSVLLSLSGCATLSKEECSAANWRSIGFEDGSRGYLKQRIGSHREACAEYGMSPDVEAYMRGHDDGVRQYCIPRQGFNLGKRGGSYNGVCPAGLERQFLNAFNQGKQVHGLVSKVNLIHNDIHELEKEQETLQKEIEDNEAMIILDSTSPTLRKELLAQNKKLEELIAEKQDVIFQLERKMEHLNFEIKRMRESFGF